MAAGLLALMLLAGPAGAEVAEQAANQAATTAAPSLEEQIREQQQRIAALERMVKQQSLLLEQVVAQLKVQNRGATSGDVVAAENAPQAELEVARLAGELDALAEHSAELQGKLNQLDKKAADAEKGLSAKLKGLGNFSFGGDLRLRFEPFRGGTSADRNRGRFRARFDIKNKFTDEWSAGLRISSGDAIDPISTNQTMTDFFERKFFAIDQAYIVYTPSWAKPFSLTGGKFAYTWKRTELTYDNDLNPEGLSPVLSFKLAESPLKSVKLIGFAVPFRESSSGPDSYMMGGGVETTWELGSRATLGASANYTNWFRADAIRAAQSATPATIGGSTNRNAASATAFASRFGLLDLIGQLNIDTGAKRWPVLLLFDYVTNTRACSNVDIAGVACNPRDRQGYWAEFSVGETKDQHDVQLGYTLIHIEQEAVLGAFNFSDLRAPSDVVNHRISFAYQAYKNIQLGYTLLVGRLLGTDEKWLKRSQIDLLYKF